MPEHDELHETIRIQLGPMPAMLRRILGDLLENEEDMQIVGQSTQSEFCLSDARSCGAAIVLSRRPSRTEGDCLDLILADPPLGLLELSADGHSAESFALVREPVLFDTANPAGLPGAIRRLASRLTPAAAGITSDMEVEPRITASPRNDSNGDAG